MLARMLRSSSRKKRGPVEVVEGKGIKIPVYYSPYRHTESYLLAYYAEGTRKRERVPSVEAAWRRGKELIEELSAGTAHVGRFTPKEAAAVNTAVDILRPHDVSLTEAARQVAVANQILSGLGTIEEAARLLVAERQKQQIPMKLFGQVVKEFLEEVKPPARSYRYWQDCSARLGLVAERYKDKPILEIRTLDLENHLNSIQRRICTKQGVRTKSSGPGKKAIGRNRNNYRRALCTVFSYAKRLGYLSRGVETEAEHLAKTPDRDGKIEIYTPEEMQIILDHLPDKWIPFAAIGAFAGCRAAEIHRLDWKDIEMDERHITVESSKSKTGKRRTVLISDTLYAWLAPYAQKSGWVCPHYSHDSTLLNEFAQVWQNIPVRKVKNGFRHSYASYRLAEVKSPPQVAWEMNTSERKLKDNYLELVSEKKLSKWCQIFPSNSPPKNKKDLVVAA